MSDAPKFMPIRRPPRMSEGYQPIENNFLEANQSRDNNVNNEESGNFGSEKDINFMKVKKYGEDSK
jgi:hypothetical protein